MGWKQRIQARAEVRRVYENEMAETRRQLLARVDAGEKQADIAREVGVSRQRIHQMVVKARREALL